MPITGMRTPVIKSDFRFCNDWTFQKENEKPVKVNLPHDAMLYEVREGSSRNGVNSGYFPGGKYIYEKLLIWILH